MGTHRSLAYRRKRSGRSASTILIIVGALLVVAAAAWSINAWVFEANTNRGGHHLLQQAAAREQQAKKSSTACRDSASTGAVGVLEAPTIGLTAPVEQGLSDAVLAVAVGHDPSSVWPGTIGTAVFAAHDVSYFVNADRLVPGAVLHYDTPCVTYDFKVTGHQVVKAGSPIFNTPESSIVLVTCWPTNALWFTPDRLIVTATEIRADQTSVSKTVHAAVGNADSYAPPDVRAPAALVAEGLTLATNSIPMGTMTITGNPIPSWTQSPDPLDVEQSAIEAFIGGLKSMASDRLSWWDSIAPDVSPPSPLLGATVNVYRSGLDVAITAVGTTPTAVVLTTEVAISGGGAPGNYAMSIRAVVSDGNLRVASWRLSSV